MSFALAFGFVLALLTLLAGVAQQRQPTAHASAFVTARTHAASLAPRLPFALLAAECIGRLLPRDLVATWIGIDSGLMGVAVAALAGALLPGGPMLAFPLAIALFRAGAGPEALIALVTGWALIAVNRTLVFELPLLGWRFTLSRLAVSLPLPLAAGLTATWLTGGLGL